MDRVIDKLQQSYSFSGVSLLSLLGIIFIAYVGQAALPAFNADDVIQAQYPSDAYNFIAQGRWAYFLTYAKLQSALPSPIVSTLLGSVFLLATALLACSLFGFDRKYQVYSFVLISSVSLYYGMLFSFDSTRLAYPLGNFVAILGLFYLAKQDWRQNLVGLAFLSLAPAFYPASTELAATVFLSLFLLSLLDRFERYSVRRIIVMALAIVASLLGYLLLTKILYFLTGWLIGARTDIDPLAVFSRYGEIICLFSEHSLPVFNFQSCQRPGFQSQQGVYINGAMAILFVSFNAFCIQKLWCKRQLAYIALFLVAQGLLLLAPFGLIFASKNSPFPPRSLYSVSYIYAFFLVVVLGASLTSKVKILQLFSKGIMALGVLWVVVSMITLSNKAFSEYTQSQRNLYAANRILLDIERVLSSSDKAGNHRVDLVVVNDKPRIGGVLHIPWSRERVYHLLDPRYEAASDTERKRVMEGALDRPVWPAEGSIYFDQNTLVVVLSR
ncbi:glucosyltransferase domain-containing protein [uncultured Pseudoteredinibacter sp.]|uniref:glucosyltransferase domain-containing protein n=1 Tax=uncultured Pseudoteredinibacter sp. TaxID=1641701 RepID=UPI00261A889F|nr:glucosyltransferase domain-containing protein [uncultured Pseudoteredinibacter sp.]